MKPMKRKQPLPRTTVQDTGVRRRTGGPCCGHRCPGTSLAKLEGFSGVFHGGRGSQGKERRRLSEQKGERRTERDLGKKLYLSCSLLGPIGF